MTMIRSELVDLLSTQLWQMSLVIVLIGGIAFLCGRRRPHLAHTLWTLVLIKCVTPPLFITPFSILHREPQVPAMVDVLVASYVPHFIPATHQRPIETVEAPRQSNPSIPTAGVTAGMTFSWQGLLIPIWLAGMTAFLGLTIKRWYRCHREIHESSVPASPAQQQLVQRLRQDLKVRRRFRLRLSTSGAGPFVYGFWRPQIVIPQQLVEDSRNEDSLKEVEPIIAHEMIHVRRGDTLFSILQFAAQLVWWFHPLVWWANRQASRTCEQCCDEEVVAGMEYEPKKYARQLFRVAELMNGGRPIFAMCGVRAAEITTRRIKNVLQPDHHLERRAPIYCWAVLLIAAALFLPADSSFGVVTAAPAQSNLRQQADASFAGQDWAAAAEGYEKLVEGNPQDARSWFRLGYALHAAGRLEAATVVHRKAAEFPRIKAVALYNLACALSLQGKSDESLTALKDAVDAGFWSQQPLDADKDLENVKQDARFAELAERAKPPEQRAVYRQFDFWVGDWEVFGRSGQRVGTSVISKDEHGFLITEKWTSTSGGTGTSMNYYDPSDRKWKQTWVSDDGTIVNYAGAFQEGKMQLVGERILTNGQKGLTRVSFTPLPDNRVQQFIEQSRDGKTWSTYFKGTYVRKAKES